ncbi:MAG: VCBS repeat-containing protein [Pyrinomonadaceae bacterium]
MKYSQIPQLLFILVTFTTFEARSFAAPVWPPVSFFGARAYASDQGPFFGLQKGDFDADGNIDFVTTSRFNILVAFGDGSGGFTQPISIFEFPGGNYFPVVGDFNEDGRSDIALPYRFVDVRGLALYLGRTDRTFAPPTTSHLGGDPEPTWLQTVDYDLDGNLDIVAGAESYDGNSLVFCKGNGNGSLTLGDRVTTPRGILPFIADFNTDGLPDVLYSEISTGYRIYINPGNGLFGSPTTVDLPIDDRAVGAKDVNADGRPDIITAYGIYPNRWVTVWLANGPFSYTERQDSQFAGSQNVWLGDIVDLDLDEKPDLVFNTKNKILIKKGNGDGTFGEPVEIHEGGNGFFLEDLNGDGSQDIVASQSSEFAVAGSGSVVKLFNLGGLQFSSAPSLPVPSGTEDIATGDLNNDGLNDIVVATQAGGIELFLQTAGREYSRGGNDTAKLQSGGSVLDIRAVLVADLNTDGRNDVLTVGRGVLSGNPNCLLLINQGNTNFTPSLFQAGTSELYDLAAADVNADGNLDLVTVGYGGTWVSIGNGNGTFAAPMVLDQGVASKVVVISDLNGDQNPDLSVLNYHTNKVAIYLNNGTGGFAFSSHITAPYGVSGLAVANMNSDLHPDILVSHGSGVSVSLNSGNAVFNAAVNYPITQREAFGMTSGDFNLDGHADAAVMAGSNSLVVLLNNGGGGLSNETVWGGGVETTALVSSDLDDDSRPELLLGYSTSSGGRVKLYFNLSQPPVIVLRTPFDYDGDGRSDLSVRRPSDNIWYILRGTAGYFNIEFGVPGDLIAPADFDGDGKTDIAVFRPSNGTWYTFNSGSQSFTTTGWGADGDLPVPADHDGDGRADLVVFRPSTNTWYTRFANGTFSTTAFGVAGDKPVVGDFDGDGKADIGLYRPSDNNWYILKTGFGFFVQTWGVAGDIPVPADYDGDGKTDVAVFRPSTGQWFRIQSTAGFDTVNWGANGDQPIPADYDGDGKSDVAVFRPSNATWYIVSSTSGQLIQNYGVAGDLPTQGAFIY